MASSKALEAKHEKILKELARKSDNKRCADCDTTGPSYVVINFNTFVCTVCGGIHRQFGHRVKGITMATFKPDEIAALQAGGNDMCLQQYLAKWQAKDLAKPVDRTPQKIHDWIDAVYVKKRYYSEAVTKAAAPAPLAKATSMNGTSLLAVSKPPAIEVPKPAPAASRSASITSPTASSTGQASFDPFGTTSTTPPSADSAAAGQQNGAWADFGAPTPSVPTPAAVSSVSTAAPATQTSTATTPTQVEGVGGGWASFSDPAAPAAPVAVPPAPAPVAAPAAPITAAGWQAFGDEPSPQSAAAAPANGVAAAASAQEVKPAAAKAPPPKELPLELFSEVQSLGLTAAAGATPQYGAPGYGMPPRGPVALSVSHSFPAQGHFPRAPAPTPSGFPSASFSAPPLPGAGYAGGSAPPSPYSQPGSGLAGSGWGTGAPGPQSGYQAAQHPTVGAQSFSHPPGHMAAAQSFSQPQGPMPGSQSYSQHTSGYTAGNNFGTFGNGALPSPSAGQHQSFSHGYAAPPQPAASFSAGPAQSFSAFPNPQPSFAAPSQPSVSFQAAPVQHSFAPSMPAPAAEFGFAGVPAAPAAPTKDTFADLAPAFNAALPNGGAAAHSFTAFGQPEVQGSSGSGNPFA